MTLAPSTLLPAVDFCGLTVTRLILGANPFAGYSHQSPQRDQEMVAYYTVEQIHETWRRAAAAGINTIITNNHTPHVKQALREYLAEGGELQWIAQTSSEQSSDMIAAIDEVVDVGCSTLFFHGGEVDAAFEQRDETSIRAWCDHARSLGVPVGVAGHSPEAHQWVYDLGAADFHAVCFFNCGSLHDGKGDKFKLADVHRATERIRAIDKPCIGYKIMGAGRIDARMGFEYAFERIKPGDVVNVGMHRGDNDDMVEQNAAMVREILESTDGT